METLVAWRRSKAVTVGSRFGSQILLPLRCPYDAAAAAGRVGVLDIFRLMPDTETSFDVDL
jgi:hypothetical protein